jgi:hypothetical protein
MERLNQPDEPPLPPSEDYVVAETTDESDEELSVGPIEGKTPEEAADELTGLPNLFVPSLVPEPEQPTRAAGMRFSLFELLAAMTFISIALAGATWLPLQPFVGVVGLCTLFMLLYFFLFDRPESRLAKLAWWTLVCTYLVSTAVALVRTFSG